MAKEDIRQDINDNQANWDDRAKVHINSKFYDVENLINDSHKISETTLHDYDVLKPFLPNSSISGLDLLHLQCHIGTDTLSWKRLGAKKVFGLDFSNRSLRYAQEIAQKAQAEITYVQGDARFASDKINDKFDVIVTSMGTITWLPELDDWAKSIYQLLKDGGTFMIRDDHPILNTLNFETFNMTADYFNLDVDTYNSDESYTDNAGIKIIHTLNHNWNHDFQEITSALLKAGLTIEFLGEYPRTEWPALKDLVQKDGWFVLPEDAPQIPLTFALVVKKL
ncbi:methyltransferase domain-containing protein [Companilactobacillus zhachilii]|uniref:class I SAM-dependent methyltransferase n=1 Tax=Companilactobacillus zhachilii TaxID=2304606 RepID=UPI0019223696|nr:class I SAM-dependent methyltransferase [Companilactobacillus zhachilii]MBL3530963.1 methyltransferase domain-containing protein [Companilactobacillus zhachilii]